ncbi:MAG TPA: Trk system potassium transporter TrkA [Spirochaetota bacterium]|nr:Trk system potassium transporter TrkA [Spirochaetota bacterium]HOL57212.1 Trk system potassium transporter TrkA [Spirochaetota bacterium]HPP03563.1 Trk system potassium transporter TrkA [Spirochaetota bacterium]
MKIVIAGGGNVGVTIARKLISENHDLILIDDNDSAVNFLRRELDAIVIDGDALDIKILKKAEVQSADMFIAVTNNDNTNILSCIMVKKLNPNIVNIAKIQNSYKYFYNKQIEYKDFSIDNMIDPKELSIQKILTLIEQPEAIDIVDYADNRVRLVGVKIDEDFKYLNLRLRDLAGRDEIFNNIRIVAIYRNDKIIIPSGEDLILFNDKLYFIGKIEHIERLIKSYFTTKIKFKNIIILGANQLAEELTEELVKRKKNITIIEEDLKKCKQMSEEFGGISGVSIINGYGTDPSILNEVNIEKSCFISVSNDDEYNVISAASAKNYNASKTICLIHNMSLLKIINNMTSIDAVFSPNILAVGKILSYCRTKNITSVSTFSEINAETIDLTISENINILNIPLKNVKFPKGIMIGVIIRGDDIIVPTGEDILMLNDKLILFVLPSAISEVERLFSRKFFWRFK